MATVPGVGARGLIDGRSYTVLAKVRYRSTDGVPWDELLLAHGRERRWLTIEPERGHGFLWRPVSAPKLPNLRSLQVGNTVTVEGSTYNLDSDGTKTLVSWEGDPEEEMDAGETARFVEGQGMGLRLSAEQWRDGATDVFVGVPVSLDVAKGWSSTPALPVAPRPPRTRSAIRHDANAGGLWAGLIAAAVFFLAVLPDMCNVQDECRFTRPDGTSYTAVCSDPGHGSIRVESTGRKIRGWGK